MSGLKVDRVVNHLNKFLGWYVVVPSLYLALTGVSVTWLVIMAVLLKMPPFDLIRRYEQWLYNRMKVEERGLEMQANLGKKLRYIRFLVHMAILTLLVLWVLYNLALLPLMVDDYIVISLMVVMFSWGVYDVFFRD